MNDFFETLAYINEKIYEPNQLTVKSAQEEKQNSDYRAGVFQLSSKSVRFRVAKSTPTKIGQFVTFWEKDAHHKNRPFLSNESPELLVITTFESENRRGQFIFPKEIMIKQNILQTNLTKGKMGMRVYPSWDKPTNKQAIRSQKWQVPYFIDLSDSNKISNEEIIRLYFL